MLGAKEGSRPVAATPSSALDAVSTTSACVRSQEESHEQRAICRLYNRAHTLVVSKHPSDRTVGKTGHMENM